MAFSRRTNSSRRNAGAHSWLFRADYQKEAEDVAACRAAKLYDPSEDPDLNHAEPGLELSLDDSGPIETKTPLHALPTQGEPPSAESGSQPGGLWARLRGRFTKESTK